MESFVRGFIRSSLLWLGTGVVLGLWMIFAPMQALVYRPAHMHANLLGFVSMMIFGVGYHVIPRFTGNPLWSRRTPRTHLWLANLGLLLMVTGWLLRPSLAQPGTVALGLGGITSAAGVLLFIINIWQTLNQRHGGIPAAAPAPTTINRRS